MASPPLKSGLLWEGAILLLLNQAQQITTNHEKIRAVSFAMAFSFSGFLAMSGQISEAQNATSAMPENDPILPGSSVKIEDIASKADAVFVGKVTQMGFPTPSAPDVTPYNGVKVKVLQVLRGSVSSEISIKIDILDLNHEYTPKVEGTYIFFMKKMLIGNAFQNIASKLLPATDDNIAKIKALIAATPTGK